MLLSLLLIVIVKGSGAMSSDLWLTPNLRARGETAESPLACVVGYCWLPYVCAASAVVSPGYYARAAPERPASKRNQVRRSVSSIHTSMRLAVAMS